MQSIPLLTEPKLRREMSLLQERRLTLRTAETPRVRRLTREALSTSVMSDLKTILSLAGLSDAWVERKFDELVSDAEAAAEAWIVEVTTEPSYTNEYANGRLALLALSNALFALAELPKSELDKISNSLGLLFPTWDGDHPVSIKYEGEHAYRTLGGIARDLADASKLVAGSKPRKARAARAVDSLVHSWEYRTGWAPRRAKRNPTEAGSITAFYKLLLPNIRVRATLRFVTSGRPGAFTMFDWEPRAFSTECEEGLLRGIDRWLTNAKGGKTKRN